MGKVDNREKTVEVAKEHGNTGIDQRSRRRKKVNAYEHAKQVYEQIQAERKEQREKERIDREQRNEALEKYNQTKRKMNKALKKRNKKGQPNLGAQMEVLLEKIQRKIEKDG